MKKYIFLIIVCLFPLALAAKSGHPEKPKAIWIEAHGNFTRFATKANVDKYLKKIKETGFNQIYLDVKPGLGNALYKSDILPPLVQFDNETVERDWDYLGYWIQQAKRYHIDIIAWISTTGFGFTKARQGPIYQDHRWDGKTQVAMEGNDPNKLVDIRDQKSVDAAMLNPCLPEVQSFIVSVVAELVSRYPGLKGICLDYCRWCGQEYGFSDATMKAFETYSGMKVKSRNDIITAKGEEGPLFAKWTEFRTSAVTDLVKMIREKVKSINPKMELHLWASAAWNSRYTVGQNWASTRYLPQGKEYTDTYHNTGFAKQMDVFSLGAYSEYVWRVEYPNSVWTVENFVKTYNDFIKDDCEVRGCVTCYDYNSKQMKEAIKLCMDYTKGLAIFEISHVIRMNMWGAIKEGICEAEKDDKQP
jgi:uncharacterized lipoprotein YddW (UPF0748 family)